MYVDGVGVEQSYSTAVEWIQKAAENGNSQAQFYLAVMFLNGQGVDQSYSTAAGWFENSL